MTLVNFYLLPENSPQARWNVACRLIEKAYQKSQQIYILTASAEEATQLDNLLWSQRKESFIPHALASSPLAMQTPILISSDLAAVTQYEILFNLSETIPTSFQKFTRIIEIVSNETSALSKARERFRFYREQNCQLESHHLKQEQGSS